MDADASLLGGHKSPGEPRVVGVASQQHLENLEYQMLSV